MKDWEAFLLMAASVLLALAAACLAVSALKDLGVIPRDFLP